MGREVGSVGVGGNVVTGHLSLGTIPMGTAVEEASRGAVAYIAIPVGRVTVPGRVGGRAGVRIGSTGSSNVRIGVVVAVSISGVVESIAVRGVTVGSVAMRGVGSIGRGAISVGRGDHSLTGSSAHVHLLSFTHAPLVLVSRASMTVSVGRVIIAIPVRGVAVTIGQVDVTVAIIVTIASITVSTIAAIAISIVSAVSVPSIAPISVVRSFNNSQEESCGQRELQH